MAKTVGLPEEIYCKLPFPGPALVARIIGEVTREKVKIVRKATEIVEHALHDTEAFQYLEILHDDRVTGVRDGKREYGLQIEVRCWDRHDAIVGSLTRLPHEILNDLAKWVTTEVPEVVSVTYNIARKPPSTMEAI